MMGCFVLTVFLVNSSAVALRKSFGTVIAIAVLRPHQMGRVFRRKPGNEYLLAKCWKCL